jgi:glucokinase
VTEVPASGEPSNAFAAAGHAMSEGDRRGADGRGLVVAVDVGGSKIAAALATRGGEALHVRRVRTASEDLEALMTQLTGLVDAMVARASEEVDAVALAIPGTLDRESGTAVAAANLPWRDTPLAEILARRTGLSTTVGGDGEGATLAEGYFGAAKGQPNYACLLVGTGIGGGVVVDGVLHRGAGRANPEIGHMVVAPQGPRCRCGGRGCVEAVAAGPAILARARQLGSPAADGAAVHAAALRGEPAAARAFAEAGEYLAMVLVSLWRLFEPSVFVVGGGVMSAGDILLGPLRAKMAELAPPRAPREGALRPTRLPTDASYLAAVALQLQEDARVARGDAA